MEKRLRILYYFIRVILLYSWTKRFCFSHKVLIQIKLIKSRQRVLQHFSKFGQGKQFFKKMNRKSDVKIKVSYGITGEKA